MVACTKPAEDQASRSRWKGRGLCAPFLAGRAMTSSQALVEEESIFFKGLASSTLIPHVRIDGLLDFFFFKKEHEDTFIPFFRKV